MPLSDFYGYVAYLGWKHEQEQEALERSSGKSGTTQYKMNFNRSGPRPT